MSYTPIEYIESTGTQYIDTGYYANNKTRVEISFENQSTESKYIFGARIEWQNHDYSVTYDGKYFFYYHTDEIFNPNQYSDVITLITEIPSLTIDNETYSGSDSGDFSCTYTFYVFGNNLSGTAYKLSLIKFYYMKIWDDGTLVFDLIPVLDENNVTCLYNKVTGTYLYNAGSGSFIAGEPINIPTITIGTPSRTKISSISGYDQSTVTFQSDMALNNWEARATIAGQTIGHGSGLLVETGGSLAANTNATVYVDDEELTNGDREYTITVFGRGTDGYWSDGTYEGINLFNSNRIALVSNATVSGNNIVFNTGSSNTSYDDTGIKVQTWTKNAEEYVASQLWESTTGIKSTTFALTQWCEWLQIGLNGNVLDAGVYINLEDFGEGDTFTLSFNIEQLSLNSATISNISLVKVVV